MSTTLSGDLRSPISTSGTDDLVLFSSERISRTDPEGEVQRNRAKWQLLIDDKLVEWGKNLGFWADEEITPPASEIIDRACSLALKLRDESMQSPERVVPDGDGGISFEWFDRPRRMSMSIELSQEGETEYLVFHNSSLVLRRQLFFD